MSEEIEALTSGPHLHEHVRGSNARAYAVTHWTSLSELKNDAETMTPGTFKRKHRVDVSEYRGAVRRLRQLATEGRAEDDEEVQTICACSSLCGIAR